MRPYRRLQQTSAAAWTLVRDKALSFIAYCPKLTCVQFAPNPIDASIGRASTERDVIQPIPPHTDRACPSSDAEQLQLQLWFHLENVIIRAWSLFCWQDEQRDALSGTTLMISHLVVGHTAAPALYFAPCSSSTAHYTTISIGSGLLVLELLLRRGLATQQLCSSWRRCLPAPEVSRDRDTCWEIWDCCPCCLWRCECRACAVLGRLALGGRCGADCGAGEHPWVAVA